jgi:hypothetical protein
MAVSPETGHQSSNTRIFIHKKYNTSIVQTKSPNTQRRNLGNLVYNIPLRMGYRLTTWGRFGGIDLTSRSTLGHKRAACFDVAIVHGARASGVSTREADRASNRGFVSDIRIEFYPRVVHRSLNTILCQIQRYEYDDERRVYSLHPVSKEISGISERS